MTWRWMGSARSGIYTSAINPDKFVYNTSFLTITLKQPAYNYCLYFFSLLIIFFFISLVTIYAFLVVIMTTVTTAVGAEFLVGSAKKNTTSLTTETTNRVQISTEAVSSPEDLQKRSRRWHDTIVE